MIALFSEPHIDHFRDIWNRLPGEWPEFSRSYGPADKEERETMFSSYAAKLKSLQQQARPGDQQVDNTKFFDSLGKFLRNVYDFSDSACQIILHRDFIEVSKTFFREARKFDATLRSEDIYQAIRNVWIMNGLQLLLGKSVSLTPSLFAYSLLYPYSDNLIDDPDISRHDKILFCQKFGQRLAGMPALNGSHTERKIDNLVEMIEKEYPRKNFPEVWQSLMEIHDAQVESLKLVRPEKELQPEELLRIGFYKGGASVLADGFLVAGKLSPDIQRFFFGFGIWLQLVDDLQDLPEDTKSETHTLFSCNGSAAKRESISNQTIHFGRKVLEEMDCCPADITRQFKEVIRHSIELMLIQSVGLNHSWYPGKYCSQMEIHSPIGFKCLRDARKKGSTGRMQMITRLMDVQ